MYSINCRGKLLSLERPQVMGIINATPDSFYQGHLGLSNEALLQLAADMVAEGAAILDIGGQSTRPGSQRLSAAEEIDRLVPLIEMIHRQFPGIPVSADTYSSEVARAAVAAGASIINDISGGEMDAAMLTTVGALQVPYICMHMQGTPDTMQQSPHYTDVVQEVLDYFIAKLAACEKAGIKDLVIDPGFGFGKTITHNFQLLKNLSVFKMLDKPVLAGLSRKSTIYRTLGTDAAGALNGSTVLNTIALLNGASILRVHDVKEAREAVLLVSALQDA